MASNRFRLQFPFWLDVNKPEEFELAETIDQLKTERVFSQTIRDGIRLICDLRAGRLDVLFALFPWVRAEFLEYMQGLQPASPEIDPEVKSQLARLEQLLLEQGNQPAGNGVPRGLQKINSGPRPLTVPASAPPDYEDEDDTDLLVVKPATGGNSAAQFLQAAFALQGIEYRQ